MCFEERWIDWLRLVLNGFRISGVETSGFATEEVVH